VHEHRKGRREATVRSIFATFIENEGKIFPSSSRSGASDFGLTFCAEVFAGLISTCEISKPTRKITNNRYKMKAPKFVLAVLLSAAGLTAHADTFKIDPVHSSMAFSIKHLGVSDFYGRFNEISGQVIFDKDDPSKNSVEVTIPTESIDTKNEKRDQHLKSPDFFNAKQFPTIVFKSKSVEGSGDTYKATGDLTLHGVTKPLTLDIKRGPEGKGMEDEIRAGGETRFTIKRSDFGMNFMQGALGDEVTIFLSLEGVRQ
jgi:polyisoprenoid-binding protein YceI